MRAEARRIGIGHAVIADVEHVQLDTLELRLNALPLHEDPRRIGVAAHKAVPNAEHRRRVLGVLASTPVGLDHPLDDAAFKAGGVGCIAASIEVLRARATTGLQRYDGGGVPIAEKCSNSFELRPPRRCVPTDDSLRRVDGKVRLPCRQFAAWRHVLWRALGGVLRGEVRSLIRLVVRREQRHIQPRLSIQPCVLGDIEPEVIAVRCPI
mmetsp:Transcript_122090/g.352909  ORF Transcript_122090/g.352909 Transcript_122090/m.352909 type:complete len:209 (+) Transcript_122090:580-1206(+)